MNNEPEKPMREGEFRGWVPVTLDGPKTAEEKAEEWAEIQFMGIAEYSRSVRSVTPDWYKKSNEKLDLEGLEGPDTK